LGSLIFDGIVVDDISALADKTALFGLEMTNLDAEQIDLAPLVGLKKLTYICTAQNKAKLLNIRTLGEIKTLEILEVLQGVNISDEDLAWLSEQLPYCLITDRYIEYRQ